MVLFQLICSLQRPGVSGSGTVMEGPASPEGGRVEDRRNQRTNSKSGWCQLCPNLWILTRQKIDKGICILVPTQGEAGRRQAGQTVARKILSIALWLPGERGLCQGIFLLTQAWGRWERVEQHLVEIMKDHIKPFTPESSTHPRPQLP